MKVISIILYFLSNHPVWGFFAIFAFFSLITILRGKVVYIILGFVLAFANVFLGHIVNAWFLNTWGVRASAVITHGEQTNSMMNDYYIWDYDAVVKTADGRDVVTKFSTMSAAIYPIRNTILIPNTGEEFFVKYIPGYEKNIVILSDESRYGKMRIIYENRGPVDKAAAQLAVSPNNKEFKEEYLRELKKFVADEENSLDTATIRSFKETISFMETW